MLQQSRKAQKYLKEVPKENNTKVDSGFADESGNMEDGFWKCPFPKCGKTCRKDSLLKMHLKHYHPELKVTRGIANVKWRNKDGI